MTKAAELAKMGEVLTNSQIGRKNIIINGAMQVAQRSASVTGLGAASGYFTLDRFNMEVNSTSAGRFTMSQSAVTDLNGFSNALKVDCTTADTSIAAGEILMIEQFVEGLNCQQLKASSTSTNAFTLSFYAKSNANRVIASEIRMTEGTNIHASKVHTIGTSWARYTMTIPAASSTEIDNDNTLAIQINFIIHGGATFTGGTIAGTTLTTLTQANRAAGIGSIFASTDNTLEITGLQLEVGSQATPFEHRSFGEELALCERYYFQKIKGNDEPLGVGVYKSSSQIRVNVEFPTEMRSDPTVITTNATNHFQAEASATDNFDGNWQAVQTSTTSGMVYSATNVSSTQGEAAAVRANSTDARLAFNSEL